MSNRVRLVFFNRGVMGRHKETVDMLRTMILVAAAVLAFGVNPAFAQWDLRGCSQYGVTAADPQSLEASLWTFRSEVWDGYIDFQEDGKYLTHWGFGTWTQTADFKGIHLANDYNDKTYELAFTDNGFRFQGIRSDGLIISGQLLCNKYAGPGPQVSKEVAEQVAGVYKYLLERDPTRKELRPIYQRMNKGATIEEITADLQKTQEARVIAARRAAEQAEAEKNGTLGW
ncbi:MAG: hypothetical protein KA403_08265 [Candidatus Omnitrophica bacterium]|nr:hypothetical protein [Candidatus Omnitrophota bacterium]